MIGGPGPDEKWGAVDVDAHVDTLEREGRRLVAAARRAGPDAPVPTCPAWRVRELLAHVGYVHRWARRYVATGLGVMVAEPSEAEILSMSPPGLDPCTWVAEGHAALVRALRRAPDGLQCWTFLEAPSALAMWARRQAHETAVHRVDAELAAGPGPVGAVDAAFAADGLDELLFGFFGRRRRAAEAASGVEAEEARREGRPAGRRRVILLEPVDRPERWTVLASRDGVEATRGAGVAGPGDIRVRAGASDLYLLMWHRLASDGLEVAGDARAFDELWRGHGVTWG